MNRFNAGFPPLKQIKTKKGHAPKLSELNIKNILNSNIKPMIEINKQKIDVIDSL